MQLHGAPLTTSFVRQFVLPRGNHEEPLVLQLSPLPLGFHQRMRSCGIDAPVAPVKIARDSQGRPIRDAQGTAVTIADVQNSDYLTSLERYHQRIAVLALAESLRADPHVEFETPVPAEGMNWGAYADTLFQELEQAGFTAGDLIVLCREICSLSNLLDENIAAAQKNFSSGRTRGSS